MGYDWGMNKGVLRDAAPLFLICEKGEELSPKKGLEVIVVRRLRQVAKLM